MSKINPINLYNYLRKNDIDFFTGVPDSLLKEFNNVILCNSEKKNHIITANEGSAIAIATGYHFATKHIPLVYLQNSGTGNIINPLMSLASKDVYSIPMLIVIGWRGEPGVKDEPQHVAQGKCMIDLIKSLNLSYDILPFDEIEANVTIDNALEQIKNESKPHVILVRKNTFSKYSNQIDIINKYKIYRKEAIEFLIKYFKDKGVKDILKRKDENLIQSGVMDSLDIVTLVFEIKKNFNIKIDITNNKTLNEFSTFKGLINIKKISK